MNKKWSCRDYFFKLLVNLIGGLLVKLAMQHVMVYLNIQDYTDLHALAYVMVLLLIGEGLLLDINSGGMFMSMSDRGHGRPWELGTSSSAPTPTPTPTPTSAPAPAQEIPEVPLTTDQNMASVDAKVGRAKELLSADANANITLGGYLSLAEKLALKEKAIELGFDKDPARKSWWKIYMRGNSHAISNMHVTNKHLGDLLESCRNR